MKWNFENGSPIYLQIIEQMKAAISNGTYPPGSKLPSIRDLSMEAGVNPNTLQRALSVLEQEKLIITQRTNGKVVTEDMELLHTLRSDTCQEIIESCIERMAEIGLDDTEIMQLFTEVMQNRKELDHESIEQQ